MICSPISFKPAVRARNSACRAASCSIEKWLDIAARLMCLQGRYGPSLVRVLSLIGQVTLAACSIEDM